VIEHAYSDEAGFSCRPLTRVSAIKPLHYANALLGSFCATLLLIAGGMVHTTHADKTTPALTAEQAIACIRTAVTAQAGMVKEVEAEDEGGKRLCEVKLVGEAGKRYTLYVDVTSHAVVKVKAR
jgi:hypothetical protein